MLHFNKKIQKCSNKHHTSTHIGISQNPGSKQNTDETTKSADKSTNKPPEAHVLFSHTNLQYNQPQVLLATAKLHVSSSRGNVTKARALIDPGSETSLISERLARRLKLDRHQSIISLMEHNLLK